MRHRPWNRPRCSTRRRELRGARGAPRFGGRYRERRPSVVSSTAGSVGSRLRLTLGPRTYDLSTRALVVGLGDEADLAELAEAPGPGLVRLPAPTPDLLRSCAAAGAAVIVPANSVEVARAAGLPSDRIVPDTMVLDVTGSPCPVAATAVGVIRGARIVRTSDVRGARRICEVLAAVMEAC